MRLLCTDNTHVNSSYEIVPEIVSYKPLPTLHLRSRETGTDVPGFYFSDGQKMKFYFQDGSILIGNDFNRDFKKDEVFKVLPESGSWKSIQYILLTGDYEIQEEALSRLIEVVAEFALKNNQKYGSFLFGKNAPIISNPKTIEQINLLQSPIDEIIQSGTYKGYNGLGWSITITIEL